jgi:hypothetical protein
MKYEFDVKVGDWFSDGFEEYESRIQIVSVKENSKYPAYSQIGFKTFDSWSEFKQGRKRFVSLCDFIKNKVWIKGFQKVEEGGAV